MDPLNKLRGITAPSRSPVFLNLQTPEVNSVLTQDHLADLRRSGLTDETITKAGIRTVPPDVLERTLRQWGLHKAAYHAQSAYFIPYPGLDGFGRLRLFYAPHAPADLPKYVQAPDTGCRLYVPPGVEAHRERVRVPLWITEGEKKALRLSQDGEAAVALGGVWSFRGPDGDLMPDLQAWAWRGRVAFLAFDVDLWDNVHVQDALYELALRLTARDADVYIVAWDPDAGKGIDDALASGKVTVERLKTAAVPLVNFVQAHGRKHRPAVIRALAEVELSPTVRDALQRALAKALKVTPKAVAAEVRAHREAKAAEALPVPDKDAVPALLRDPDFIEHYLAAVRAVHAGDDANALALLLAWGTLRFERPVSVIITGPPATGKSHLLETSRKLWPEASYVRRSSLSPKILAYTNEPLSHRAVILAEAASIVSSDEAGYLIRTLLSEGLIVHETVEKTPAGLRPVRLEREGPTALICTTTRYRLEEQLASRVWLIESRSDAQYIGTVLDHQAGGAPAEPPGAEAIRAALAWLYFHGTARVRIPEKMRKALRSLMPGRDPKETRLFDRLLRSVEASAFLHQLQRPRDADGAVLATEADYAIARRALAEAFTTGLSDLTPKQREVLKALANLDHPDGVRLKDVAEALGADRGNTVRYLQALQKKGYASQDPTTKRWRALEDPGPGMALPERLTPPPGPDPEPPEGAACRPDYNNYNNTTETASELENFVVVPPTTTTPTTTTPPPDRAPGPPASPSGLYPGCSGDDNAGNAGRSRQSAKLLSLSSSGGSVQNVGEPPDPGVAPTPGPDGDRPEGWPPESYEPARNPEATVCWGCGRTVPPGMAVRSRLDPEGRLWHVNCAPVAEAKP